MVADARYLFEFLDIRVQNPRQASESVQQGVGNGVGILLWDGIEKQQFQGLYVRKGVQTRLLKPRFQPLAVSFVQRWIGHKNSPCYFYRFPLE